MKMTENCPRLCYAHSKISKHSSNDFAEFHKTPVLEAFAPAWGAEPLLSRWSWETLLDLSV